MATPDEIFAAAQEEILKRKRGDIVNPIDHRKLREFWDALEAKNIGFKVRETRYWEDSRAGHVVTVFDYANGTQGFIDITKDRASINGLRAVERVGGADWIADAAHDIYADAIAARGPEAYLSERTDPRENLNLGSGAVH